MAEKKTVVGKIFESSEVAPSDPAWLELVKREYPKNLTFHALIREIFKVAERENPPAKARALAIIGAAKKVFPAELREKILRDLDEKGKLRGVLDLPDDSIDDGEDYDLESAILESLDD